MKEDTRSIFEHAQSENRRALEITDTKTIVVGLGGSESWAVLLAATVVVKPTFLLFDQRVEKVDANQ